VSSASWNSATGPLTPDNWLISPPITLNGEGTIQYYVAAQDPQYPFDKYGVYFSTGGTSPSDFTLLHSETLNSSTWAVRNIPVTGGTIRIAFRHFDCTDWFVMKIDEVRVFRIGEAIQCDPATNLAVTYTADCKAELTWTASPDAISYNILRNGNIVGNATGTTYTDENFDPLASHIWGIKVVCAEIESAATTKEMSACINCAPATNLNVAYVDAPDNCDAVLTWNAPAKGRNDEVILQYSGDMVDGIGIPTASHQITPANRWTSEDLASLGVASGMVLDKVGFTPYQTHNATFTIKVWQGGSWSGNSGDPGTELVSQILTSASLTPGIWNIIELTEPVTIDATKELWIGYFTDNVGGGNSSGCDAGPHINNKANICFMDGWTTMVALNPALTYNWCVRGYVGGEPIPPPPPVYNVYRNGVKLTTTPIEETTYTDAGADPENGHTWEVKVACVVDSESFPISETLEACDPIGINDIVKTTFTIVPNPAKDKIQITADSHFNKIEIVNFLGQTVLSQSNDKDTATVNVSNLTNGVYFVRIISENGTSVQKFVKK
jgi:hypothetical protein